jgi:hypothetical protein
MMESETGSAFKQIGIIKRAELHFGEVILLRKIEDNRWLLVIRRDNPPIPEKPLMQITAFSRPFSCDVGFCHGYYDLDEEMLRVQKILP